MKLYQNQNHRNLFSRHKKKSDMDDDTIGDSIGLNCIQPMMSIHLFIVRCDLSQPKEKDDWRRTTMFHTIMKIGGRSCKIIVDSGSCINTVSSTVITKLGLKVVPHPHSYIVTWINLLALEVKQRCLVLIDFSFYNDKICCDVVFMDVGHVILGRLRLYDNDVTIYSRSNMCQFEHEGKKIKLLPRGLKLNHLNQSLLQWRKLTVSAGLFQRLIVKM